MIPIRIGLFDIEFVPQTSWHRSIACLSSGRIWFGHKRILIGTPLKKIFRRLWGRIRKRELMRSDFSCEICGSGSSLHVHEVWNYDPRRKLQKLMGYRVLCDRCHRVHHSSQLIGRGEFDDVVSYIVMKNQEAGINIGRVTTESRLLKAYEIWVDRSNYFWTVDVRYERLLLLFSDIVHVLLNYWIIMHQKNNLDPWLLRATRKSENVIEIKRGLSGYLTANLLPDRLIQLV